MCHVPDLVNLTKVFGSVWCFRSAEMVRLFDEQVMGVIRIVGVIKSCVEHRSSLKFEVSHNL